MSCSTASYILGKTRGGFAKDTVEKVVRTAKEMGFRHNALARAFRTGRSRIIGLLSDDNVETGPHWYAYQFELGACIEARTHRMDVLKVILRRDPEMDADRVSEVLSTKLVDGIILHDQPGMGSLFEWLKEENATFVVVGNPGDPELYTVDVDDVSVGMVMARHLIDLGHKHLAFIAPPEAWSFGVDRVKGFLDACAVAGIRKDACVVVRTDRYMAGGSAGMQELLKNHPDVTGVCAADDQLALGAIMAATNAALSVPEDISVVGCNNDPFLGAPPDFLTTVDINFVELGSLAAANLVRLTNGEPVSHRDTIGFRLIPRKSSGPAKNRSKARSSSRTPRNA